MSVANIKIWKSHLNIREGSDYLQLNSSLSCMTDIWGIGSEIPYWRYLLVLFTISTLIQDTRNGPAQARV